MRTTLIRGVSSYLKAPVTCERLEPMLPRFGGTVSRVVPTETVHYALPVEATGEVKTFLAAQSRPEIESTGDFIAHLPGGRVVGPGHVLSPDGVSIARDVSPDFGKAPDDHWLLGFEKLRAPVFRAGETVVVATTLGEGYYHWLIDELPRLLTLGAVSGLPIIAHNKLPFHREALQLQGIEAQIVAPARYSHFACEQLIVPSLPGRAGYPTSRSLGLVGALVEPLVSPAAGRVFGERLYISRDKAARRRVANETELWAALEARGFVRVFLEDLTWREQIHAFRHAKVIVAPHGAGLANVMFCAEGTCVVELFNRSYLNGCYWRIAALKALDYRPIVPTGAEPLGAALKDNRRDIEADVSQVLAALA